MHVIKGTIKDGVDQLIELADAVIRTAQTNADQGVPGAKGVVDELTEARASIVKARTPAERVRAALTPSTKRFND